MRASLAAHLRRAIGGGRFGALARGSLRAAAARFDVPLPRPLAGPLLATFAITYRCPLACAMCDLPSRHPTELSDETVLRFVDAIAELRPLGLGFTGGEPLLRDVLFPAIERSVARGIVTHLNTSGVGLSEERASRLAASGVASINVSIDHDDPRVHDELRGRPRALEHALSALRRLADARVGVRNPPRLQAMMAVANASLPRIAAVRDLALAHGADALSILPLHDFPEHPETRVAARHGFGAGRRIDSGPEHTPSQSSALRTETAAIRVSSSLDSTVREPQPAAPNLLELGLENSRTYLAGVAPFLTGARTPGPCSAARSALFLDPRGKVFACTPGATLDRDGIAVEPESLADLVRSGALERTVPRDQCERCWWNCHRELDIAIGRARMPTP